MSPQKSNYKTLYAISVAWQLGFLIVVPLGGFLFLGYWADNVLATQPFFLILSVVVGMAITIYEIYHVLAPLIKDSENND